MKHFRVFALLLMAALCLIGCQSGETAGFSPKYAKETGYFCFPNTEWGMTEEEFYAASGTKAADFNVETSEQKTPARSANGVNADGYTVTNHTLSGSAAYWNRTMDASLDFISRPYFPETALWRMTLIDRSCKSEEDFRSLCEVVEAWADEQEVPLNAGKIQEGKKAALACEITSVATANQLPKELLDGYNRAARYFYFDQHWAQANATPATADTDFASSMDGYASTLLIEWVTDAETADAPLARITFSGRETCMIIAHARDSATLPAEEEPVA